MAVYVKEETKQVPVSNESSQEDGATPRKLKGCLRKLLIGLGVWILLSGILIWILHSIFTPSPVEIEDNTIYRIDMVGEVVERTEDGIVLEDLLSGLLGEDMLSTKIGLDDLLNNIELAKNNDKVKGIYLHGGSLSISPASAKEFRDALLDFKSSGKFVIAYADSYTQTNYYIASVADKVYMSPVGSLAWDGLSAQQLYYKRLLDKVGVDMQILKVGEYKSAVEPYSSTSMSPEDREQTEKYLRGIWDVMKDAVAKSRHLSAANLDSYADECMSLQPQSKYVEYGFVDELLYVQDMDSILRTFAGTEEYHVLTHAEMNKVDRVVVEADDKLAIVYLDGVINDTGDEGIVTEDVVKCVKEIRDDESVKAVVWRVNSPGGSASASEQIWYAIKTLQDKGLPVVVSMGDYAASGGYYISCHADYIYAEPTTLTGSIGIFGMIPSFDGLRDKIGIDVDTVSTNMHSSLSANAVCLGMNSKERALMQTMVERGYDLFTKRCAEGRGLSQDSIKAIGEGRVWLGKDALELGLVDAMGNMNDAIKKAASLAKLGEYELVYYPQEEDLQTIIQDVLSVSTTEEQLLKKLRDFVSQPRVMTLMPKVIIK